MTSGNVHVNYISPQMQFPNLSNQLAPSVDLILWPKTNVLRCTFPSHSMSKNILLPIRQHGVIRYDSGRYEKILAKRAKLSITGVKGLAKF